MQPSLGYKSSDSNAIRGEQARTNCFPSAASVYPLESQDFIQISLSEAGWANHVLSEVKRGYQPHVLDRLPRRFSEAPGATVLYALVEGQQEAMRLLRGFRQLPREAPSAKRHPGPPLQEQRELRTLFVSNCTGQSNLLTFPSQTGFSLVTGFPTGTQFFP